MGNVSMCIFDIYCASSDEELIQSLSDNYSTRIYITMALKSIQSPLLVSRLTLILNSDYLDIFNCFMNVFSDLNFVKKDFAATSSSRLGTSIYKR